MAWYVSCMSSPSKPVICVSMHVEEGLVEDKKQGSRSDGDDSSMQTWEASAMDGAQ